MKARTLSLMAGIGGSLLMGSGAQAAFTGITVDVKSGTTAGTGGGTPGVDVFVCNVYANFSLAGDQLIAVAGTPNSPMLIEVIGGTFFQQGGMGAGDFTPTTLALSMNTDLVFDSFISIDAKVIGSALYGGEFATDALGTNPGWPGFNASTLGPSSLDTMGTNITWFVTASDAPQGLSDDGQHTPSGVAGSVLLGQFASADSTNIQGTFLIQYDSADGGAGQQATMNFSHGVPAPGALALLGVAGLVGRRRRRN